MHVQNKRNLFLKDDFYDCFEIELAVFCKTLRIPDLRINESLRICFLRTGTPNGFEIAE
jgi:hypothetical protein